MNHKRKRPKNRRAGCLWCKPHKSNDMKDSLEHQTIQERKAIEAEEHDLETLEEIQFEELYDETFDD